MTSKLTRERIELIANFHRAMALPPSHAEIEELARMALAAMDSEPVAEVLSNRPGNDTSTIDRALPVGTQLYRHAQPAPVVPEKCPAEIRDLISSHTDALFNDDDAQEIWNACRATMLQASPVCTCPSGGGSLRWPCPVRAGSSPVIPDGSMAMLRRWLAFGRGMQNAGSQLPRNLIAETEEMLAAAPQEVNHG